MEHTLKLKTMALRWRDILMDSDEIKNFCLGKYNKLPTIFMGVNSKAWPSDEDCPYIAILPGVKVEGLDQSELIYSILVSWSIKQRDVMVDGVLMPWQENISGNLIEYMGTYETDDFGQLIYETLQQALEDSFPISKLDYAVEVESYWPQFPGDMVLTTIITPALGEELEY